MDLSCRDDLCADDFWRGFDWLREVSSLSERPIFYVWIEIGAGGSEGILLLGLAGVLVWRTAFAFIIVVKVLKQFDMRTMSKTAPRKFKVLFVAGFGPIVRDIPKSHAFYVDALGLSLDKDGDYLHTGKLDGVKHFALWPLSQAAQSCFGSESWPSDLPIPQSWLEFDVDDIEQASAELKSRGYRLLTRARKEPWGQIVTRLLSPEGILVAVTVTPAMRE